MSSDALAQAVRGIGEVITEVFKNSGDVELEDIVSGWWDGLRLDLGILEVLSNLNDSVIL